MRMSSPKHLAKLSRLGRDFADWYPRALREIRTVCELEHWSINAFADILAITSPRVSVRRNVRITLQYMHEQTLLPNVMQGIRASLDFWNEQQTIRGFKTEAFRRAILGDSAAVVLDVHMANAMRCDQKLFATKRGVLKATKRIEATAKLVKLSPRDTQATIWAGSYKLLNGNWPPYFPILAEYETFLAFDKSYPQSGSIDNSYKLLRRARFDSRQLRLFQEVA